MEPDLAALRKLKHCMDKGVGANAGGFPTRATSSKYMRRAKKVLMEVKYSAQHPQLAGQPMFSEADLMSLRTEHPEAMKMMAFVQSQGILNLFNDDASTHEGRQQAFRGVTRVAYEAMDIGMYDYVSLTPEKLIRMGKYLAELRWSLPA